MSAVTNKSLADLERKLTLLLMEVRATPVFFRVKAYVSKLTGDRLLSEYLKDENVPVKERAALAEALCDVLLTKSYDRLPDVTQPASVPHVNGWAHASPEPDEEPEAVAALPADLQRMVRAEVRRELAGIFEIVAKILRE